MAYNTVSIIKDVDGKPTPQYFNQLQNAYEVLQGRNGANYVEILGPNGETLSIVENKLAVRATEIEALLNNLNGKDFATEEKLETVRQLLASLNQKDYATEARLQALETKIDQLLLAQDENNTMKVQQTGSIVTVKKYNNISIPAQSIIDIFEIDSSNNTIYFPYTALRLGYVWVDEPTNWQIEIIHRLDGYYNGYTEIIKQGDQRILKATFSNRQMIIEKKILACYMSSDRLRLRFWNGDDSEKEIGSLYVMGVI